MSYRVTWADIENVDRTVYADDDETAEAVREAVDNFYDGSTDVRVAEARDAGQPADALRAAVHAARCLLCDCQFVSNASLRDQMIRDVNDVLFDAVQAYDTAREES